MAIGGVNFSKVANNFNVNEMDVALKNKIAAIQIKFIKAIKSHKDCYDKLQNGNDSEEVAEEFQRIKKLMLDCHKEQEKLLNQLDDPDNPKNKFDLYNKPPAALPKKNRRRKDLITPVEEKKSRNEVLRARTPSPVAMSSDSLSSSDESEEDEEDDENWSQSSLPISYSQPSYLILRKGSTLSRNDVQYPKQRRGRRTDYEEVKELPVYTDPPPSPEPATEEEAKLKFMAALNLIPVATKMEILAKKTERKRRSTTNNSQYFYNNDWEIPAMKRKQYLSPVKAKPAVAEKEKSENMDVDCDDDTVVNNSSEAPDIEGSDGTKCKICSKKDVLIACSVCCEFYHPKCHSIPELEQSFLMCRRCNNNPTMTDQVFDSVEDSPRKDDDDDDDDEEEHERAILFNGRLKTRNHLLKVLRCRKIEKNQMERTVLTQAESLAVQERFKMNIIQETAEIEAKIEKIRAFVTLYQMHSSPNIVKDEEMADVTILPENAASDKLHEEKPTSPLA